MHIDFNKLNGYIEDNDGSKYLTLILVDGTKGEVKKYKETWNKIRYLTQLENNDSGKDHGKYIKFLFTSIYR